MKKEERTVYYDPVLEIGAYEFIGIKQKFPNHFHEYYVLGFIESGLRHLSCKNQEYTIKPGDMVIFNPGDNHACEQVDGMALDYRCLEIKEEVMRKAVKEITGEAYLPVFTSNVVRQCEQVFLIREIHEMIKDQAVDFEKEEKFYFLIEHLLSAYTDKNAGMPAAASEKVKAVCQYLEHHFADCISLEVLSQLAGMNKYTLLRNFVKQKGVTPYQYLETVRIGEAKKLLEAGVSPVETSCRTGFTDQSHFSRFFKKLIGLSPGQYQKMISE